MRHFARPWWAILVACLATVGAPRFTAAQNVTVGGVGYAQYGYALSDTANRANGFSVTRAYINITGNFGGGLVTRITPDLYADPNGSLVLRIKYAYAAFTPGSSALTFKLGMIHTPWVDWEEGLWGYRMQGTMAVERAGYMTSADVGAGVDGAWGKQLVTMQVGLYNGEGYKGGIGDKRKDVMGRASVRLLSTNDESGRGGLRLTVYGQYGKPTGGGERTRAIGMLSYKSQMVTLAAEAVLAKDSATATPTPESNGRLVSGYGAFNIPNTKAALVGRVDWWEPDNDTPGDQQTRLIGGVSYQLHQHLRLLADLDYLHYQSTPTPAQEVSRVQGLFQIEFTF